ncbi:MAG: hypothetical protein PWQ09_1405 [Candidatus Cloacimonadota bacterium]|jgi:Kef-type K+ transport system membrane component KefB/mannitol/fructose-specific phosphotransferase system IIA component (Ntr-type)|nr:hypothetical protein [Candidatus Cloacimonadota bacterium]
MFAHISKWFQGDVALIQAANPLLVLSVILITGYIFNRLARKLHIPTVTCQILGGVVLGPYVLNLFVQNAYTSFVPITNFALGFIGLTIGSHLDFRKLHNAGRRIAFITLADAIITPVVVFFSLQLFTNVSLEASLLISAIAITTAPSSTLHIVREKRAKGIFTKTLLAVVALNNVITIVVFYTVYYFIYYITSTSHVGIVAIIIKPLLLLVESIIIGSVVGYAVIYFTEKRKTRVSFLVMVMMAVIITVGTAETLHLSGILSSLILGMVISNFSKNKNTLFGAFKDIETEVYTLFFVLAGTHLDFAAIKIAGSIGFVLILSRLFGKTVGSTLGAWLAGSTDTIKKWIGIALYPIAGVAIGLVLLIENNELLSIYSSEITSVVLTAVVVNELLGPILTGKALQKSGEVDKNRLRLMDFIQEEFIKVDMQSDNKWDALAELTEFMYKTHKCHEISLEKLKNSFIEREKQVSTGIGNNLAIPHAIIEGGPKIRGVIGISKKGIKFDAVDDKPVHIIFLIATPKEHYDRQHLQVLSNIAKIFGQHPHIKKQMLKANTPEEVFEILQTEEVEELNPFFED